MKYVKESKIRSKLYGEILKEDQGLYVYELEPRTGMTN